MVEGRLSLDQVGVIATRAADGSDEHYAQLAAVASVSQLRTAVKFEPRPKPNPRPEPQRSITKTSGEESTSWKITLPHDEAATFDAALQSHRDALITEYKNDHDPSASESSPPLPNTTDAFMRLVEAGWDTEVARRPHGQRTTVVVHVDIEHRVAALHVGPLLSDAERQYLTCDATCEVWFERDGQPIGAGRTTRTVNRRLRRALEHRHPTCAVPGCGATRGLHAHHIQHSEDGGPTELANLVLLCPYHHREHHRGEITISGPADHLTVIDRDGEQLTLSIARPSTQRSAAQRAAVSRTHRRTRRLEVVPTLRTTTPTTNRQLGSLPGAEIAGSVSKLKQVGALGNSFACARGRGIGVNPSWQPGNARQA